MTRFQNCAVRQRADPLGVHAPPGRGFWSSLLSARGRQGLVNLDRGWCRWRASETLI